MSAAPKPFSSLRSCNAFLDGLGVVRDSAEDSFGRNGFGRHEGFGTKTKRPVDWTGATADDSDLEHREWLAAATFFSCPPSDVKEGTSWTSR